MRKGKILLVGFGPGSESHMSVRALQAIEEADVVIGYSTYIRLVKNLLDGKEIIRKGMTEEIDRCLQAYEQAKQGKVVVLVSSGDIGVYGMAGPTYEVLLQSGWTPDSDIEVEIVPGTTALSASAALVGAPLTHDFCSISLSDLLTPWPVIAKRLDAAGRSDFVIALYNPKSGRRTGQIAEAQRILLQYRKADTPVAIVKSAFRDLQEIQRVRLDEMKDCKIGMLTTVLIGNSSTFMREGLMITPRGYSNKYDGITGATLDGETRGRSLGMGLEGWKACVRQHLRNHGEQSLHAISRHFDTDVGEILSAIADATDDDPAADFSSLRLPGEMQLSIIPTVKHWGPLRVVVRSEAGAVSELFIQAKDLMLSGEQLKIENEYFHLHIDWSRVTGAWLLRRAEQMCGIYFLDKHNVSVFSLSLLRKDGVFDVNARQRFEQLWQESIRSGQRAIAANE
ncbi:Cobalt-precorrin-3 C(17)-methyltransferase [hydrothermal vent metagenome]|uniref:Cobalt-precorrin-3 C(17)-methyltransferase n=1 Tax=hydrothermal vent metagenome TaxID=652676 RepID=A0A3B1C4V0_9ZZZZ